MSTTNAVNSSSNIPDWMTNSNPKAAKTEPNDQAASKETFLKLMVAQLRNQNPLNPADGVQFLTQLAQFSDLEQTIRMREELTSIRTALEKYVGTDEKSESDGSETKKG